MYHVNHGTPKSGAFIEIAVISSMTKVEHFHLGIWRFPKVNLKTSQFEWYKYLGFLTLNER